MTARLGVWSLPLGSASVLASRSPGYTHTMGSCTHIATLVDQPSVAPMAWLRYVRLAPPTKLAAGGLGVGRVCGQCDELRCSPPDGLNCTSKLAPPVLRSWAGPSLTLAHGGCCAPLQAMPISAPLHFRGAREILRRRPASLVAGCWVHPLEIARVYWQGICGAGPAA